MATSNLSFESDLHLSTASVGWSLPNHFSMLWSPCGINCNLWCNSGPEAVHLLVYKRRGSKAEEAKGLFHHHLNPWNFLFVLFSCKSQRPIHHVTFIWATFQCSLNRFHLFPNVIHLLKHPGSFGSTSAKRKKKKGWSNKVEVRSWQCKANFTERCVTAQHWFSYLLSMQRWQDACQCTFSLWSSFYWRDNPFVCTDKVLNIL